MKNDETCDWREKVGLRLMKSKMLHAILMNRKGRWLQRALLAVLFLQPLFGSDNDSLRSERVGWARLQTSSPNWRVHAATDPRLMQFFRNETTLNIDPTWYAADVKNLEEMCRYPLLFSQGIQTVGAPEERHNLAEYIRRGGFLLIDACINPVYRGDVDVYIARQQQVLLQSLPGVRFQLLPNSDPIFHCFFQFPDGIPHTAVEPGWNNHGLYGIYLGRRLVGVISTSGLQCGWAGMRRLPGHDIRCMQMLVNIYIQAMMQS